ncbi:MAG: endonuclease [Myxococcales bacterium]|nr:endonuclease [Myxococcales bacterium]
MLRMMSYNVRYFGHRHPIRGAGSTRLGLRSVASAIAALAELPHVVGLQEVEARSFRSKGSLTPGDREETQLAAFLRELHETLVAQQREARYTALYFPAHAYRVGALSVYTTGLALMIRDDVAFEADGIHRDVTHRRDHPLAARFKQSRVCAHVRIHASDGAAVDVFNTHLSLPQFFSPGMLNHKGRMGWGRNQIAEAEALASFVEERRSSDRFVILGDFNAQPGSPAYHRLLERLDARDALSRWTGHGPERLRLDWPSAGFFHLRMRLDHLFLGPGLTARDFDDTQPFGAPGPFDGLSDHVPQISRIVPASSWG